MLGSAWLVPTFSGGGSSFSSPAALCTRLCPLGLCQGLAAGRPLPTASACGARLMVPTEPGMQQCCSLAHCSPGAWAEEVSRSHGCWQRGHVGSWLSHLDPLVWANPCLCLPTEPGGARGAAGSNAAGHPPSLCSGLGFTCVPSHASACAHTMHVCSHVCSHVRSHLHVAVRPALGVQGQRRARPSHALWSGLCHCMTLLGARAGGSVPRLWGVGGTTWPCCWDGALGAVRLSEWQGGEPKPGHQALIYWDGEKRQTPKLKQKTKEKSQPHKREDRGGLLGAACHLARCQPGDAPEQTCQAVIADRLISRDETVIFNSR